MDRDATNITSSDTYHPGKKHTSKDVQRDLKKTISPVEAVIATASWVCFFLNALIISRRRTDFPVPFATMFQHSLQEIAELLTGTASIEDTAPILNQFQYLCLFLA